MKTSELTGALLAHVVALADGHVVNIHTSIDGLVYSVYGGEKFIGYIGGGHVPQYAPHEQWDQGGPLIERECIELFVNQSPRVWSGFITKYAHDLPHWTLQGNGDTPLVAAMRTFVVSKFGDEVEDAHG